jgi:hypothetical protein
MATSSLTRERDAHRFLVVLSLEPGPSPPGLYFFTSTNIEGRLALSTHLDRDDEKVAGALELRGEEGVIVGLD